MPVVVCGAQTHLIEVTFHSRATAALQIRLPRKPLPPHTTSFFFAAEVEAIAGDVDRLRGTHDDSHVVHRATVWAFNNESNAGLLLI